MCMLSFVLFGAFFFVAASVVVGLFLLLGKAVLALKKDGPGRE